MRMSLDFRLTATRFLDAGASAPTLAEHRHACLRLLKKKGFTEESITTVGVCVIGTSTPLESNKSYVGVSSPRWESSPTTFVRGAVAIGYNYRLWPGAYYCRKDSCFVRRLERLEGVAGRTYPLAD